MAAGSLELPVVDLACSDIQSTAKSIRKACLECGFFYVSNHGIEGGLLEAVFAESKKFFELPLEEKMALQRNSSHRGYTAPYAEKLDASSKFQGDLKESFYIGSTEGGNSQTDNNQWPPEERFPSWKDTMKLYHATALVTSKRILSLIALSLDLDAEFFQNIGAFDCPSAVLRLLHYPGEVNEADIGNYGASAHSDYGMLTLLATDGTPGLQEMCPPSSTFKRKNKPYFRRVGIVASLCLDLCAGFPLLGVCRYAGRRIGIPSSGKMFIILLGPLSLTLVIC